MFRSNTKGAGTGAALVLVCSRYTRLAAEFEFRSPTSAPSPTDPKCVE